MICGRFRVSGSFDNLVPTCSVFPIIDFGAAREDFGFSGEICVVEDGSLTGNLIDGSGISRVTGRATDGRLMFTKEYLTGDMVGHPIEYRMVVDEDRLTCHGEYRFSRDSKNPDGKAAIVLQVQ